MFLIIDIILGILIGLLTCYFNNLLRYDICYFTILICVAFILLMFVVTILSFFIIAIPMKNKGEFCEKEKKFSRFMLDNGLVFIRQMTLARFKIENKELIPKNERFLMVINHRSKMDPILINSKLKGYHLSWIAKKSLFKMPLIKRYMFNSCFLALDRDDVRQGLRVINQAIIYINTDANSIGIFPEGTRNPNNDLLDFKAGCFKIAKRTNCKIVIVAIDKTEKIAKRWPLPTKVKIRVCEVVDNEFYKDMKTDAMASYCKDVIEKNLKEMRQ